jgi:peptidyl-prolyl cis-trans isomerase A (cyclophilin A)
MLGLLFLRILCFVCLVQSSIQDSHPVTRELSDNGETYKVNVIVASTKGQGRVIVEVHRSWAPLGAQRFYDLIQAGYYNEAKFFRVLKGFMAQIGIHKDPKVTSKWRRSSFKDDPVSHGNKRGTISFATSGKDTRTTQIFINFADNSFLDAQGFAPFGHVIEGMEYVDALYGGYGEGGRGDGTDGKGPSQAKCRYTQYTL